METLKSYGAATANGWDRTEAGCGTMPEKIYYGTNLQMKAKKMAEWISVKERLPKDKQEVIAVVTTFCGGIERETIQKIVKKHKNLKK